jgi:cathepsin A (carboxypeptidase C)
MAPMLPWRTIESGDVAGEVKSAGGSGATAGNITFVNVHEAG